MPRVLLAGVLAALGARAALTRLLLRHFRGQVERLNRGETAPLLTDYADDAVLVFNDGDHRWAGEHRGKPAIAAFLDEFVGARVQGELLDIALSGPPWAMTLWARFDDHADAPDTGERLYANRTALVLRTRWGKIVRHEDFYEDTSRIVELEQRLAERGIGPVRPR